MSWRIGVDIGGTFTDITVVGSDGDVRLWKQDTTPHRLGEAIERGLQAVASDLGLELRVLLEQTSLFVHGSTVATNTVIERRGPRVGLVCTEGFRDALYFRDGFKWDRYNGNLPRPEDFVDRYLRMGVDERVGSAGEVVRPLDEQSVRTVARAFAERGVGVVAVALLWSHVNSVHERRVREILVEELPGVPVLLSSEILPEIGEWVRTSATVLSAYVYPATAAYLKELEEWLNANGLGSSLLIMQVNGGCAGVDRTLEVPINIVHSGPAAAPAAAVALGAALGAPDCVVTDMGGTSFDVTLIQGGEVPRSRKIMVEHQPIGVPGVELHSIGAGGGSIAWIDSGGALRVGPQSAGARPGPAAYGQGGELPTVTDANVTLGYLSTTAFLGGRRSLRPELAERAIAASVAGPLATDVVSAAAGIIRVVDEHMVNAIRTVSVERGIDPRPLLLVAGGGAGALHAARLAQALGIRRTLIPSQAGTLSAFGMTGVDVRHDYSGTLHTSVSNPAAADVTALLAELTRQATEDLVRSGIAPEAITFRYFADTRYVGQIHELITPLPAGRLEQEDFTSVAEAFHALHEQRYTYRLPERDIEFLHWRVSASSPTDSVIDLSFDALCEHDATDLAVGSRPAYFAEASGFIEIPAFLRNDLRAGSVIVGPAVVDSPTTTVLVPPDHRLVSDAHGHLLMESTADLVFTAATAGEVDAAR